MYTSTEKLPSRFFRREILIEIIWRELVHFDEITKLSDELMNDPLVSIKCTLIELKTIYRFVYK